MKQKIKILVVEDEPGIRNGVADLLQIQGFSVMTATNGVEALSMMDEEVPDLIVADIMMPEMNGYQFYQRVRSNSEWLWVPFIFLSAKGEGEDVRFGKELGVEDYLIKPFNAEDLLAAVLGCLKRFHQLAESRQGEAHHHSVVKVREKQDYIKLTRRELDVLRLMVEGKNNTAIADELFVEPSTVKTHVSNIHSKLGVNNRVKAVRVAKEQQLLQD